MNQTAIQSAATGAFDRRRFCAIRSFMPSEALAEYQKLAGRDADVGKKMAQRLSSEINNMR